MPFLYTLSTYAFELRVRAELPNGVDVKAEAIRRYEAGELALSQMCMVNVEVQPKDSMACGPASVYFTDILLRMLNAADDDEYNPIEVALADPNPPRSPYPRPSRPQRHHQNR